MVAEIRIYIEGGGDQNSTKTALRHGFSEFFSAIISIVREKRINWKLVACGTRRNAYDDFVIALRAYPNALNILLVDSESQVSCGSWEHLANEGWEKPSTATDENVHFMSECMESWLIADVVSLETFYGSGFVGSRIPANTNVERIPKHDILNSLNRATIGTSKGMYHKTRHGFDLLAIVNPTTVKVKASYCKRLFDTLYNNCI
jgi:hypothetical protein